MRKRKENDFRIWGENTGSSHASITAPILRQGKTNGSLIAIDRLMDNKTIYHLEDENRKLKEALTVGRVRAKSGNWIGIRIEEKSETIFSKYENKIPFNEAVFTKERNRFGQLEYYRVEYEGI